MPRLPNPWKSVPRSFFPFRQLVPTRWADNDQYGHANNSIYHYWQDTIINNYLLQQGVLCLPQEQDLQQKQSSSNHMNPSNEIETTNSSVFPSCMNSVGICAENGFQYFSSVGYSQNLELGLCATHIGRVSVTYRVGVFVADGNQNYGINVTPCPKMSFKRGNNLQCSDDSGDKIKALGSFVHVFTDRRTQKPLAKLPDELHEALKLILVEEPKNHHH